MTNAETTTLATELSLGTPIMWPATDARLKGRGVDSASVRGTGRGDIRLRDEDSNVLLP